MTKTDKGWFALQARSHELRARERQVLIMIDGLRTRQDFVGLLGEESLGLLSRLQDGGFIQVSEQDAEHLKDTRTASVQSPSVAIRNPGRASVPMIHASMDSARQYLVSRLYEVKDANRKRFIANLDRCTDDEELVHAMVHTLMYLQGELVSEDCSNVATSLSKIVPPECWERIQGDLSLTPNSCC